MCIESALRIGCLVCSGICMVGSQTTKLMKKDVKMAYGMMVLFFSVLLVGILYVGAKYLSFAKLFMNCPDGAQLDSCLGLSAVYRLSFVLAAVHLLVGLACLTRDGFAKAVNEGLWGMKMLVVAGAFVGSLFISNNFFVPYAKASLYLGGVFLFVQAVSLIDAFYLWAQFWAKKYDDGNGCYGCLLIFSSIVMYFLAGYFVYKGFKDFWLPSCWGNMFLLFVPVVLCLAFVVLIILRFHPTGSIITSGAITVFGVYLFWAALISNTNTQCNPSFGNSRSNMFLQIGFSFFFAFACNIYWALNTGKSEAFEKANLPQVAATDGDAEIEKKTEQENKDKAQTGTEGTNLIKRDDPTEFLEYENNSYLKFHGFMVLFSVYICAVFTNWGHAKISDSTWNYSDNASQAPYYIKVFIGFFTLLLYLWTVVAPTLFPDREFNHN